MSGADSPDGSRWLAAAPVASLQSKRALPRRASGERPATQPRTSVRLRGQGVKPTASTPASPVRRWETTCSSTVHSSRACRPVRTRPLDCRGCPPAIMATHRGDSETRHTQREGPRFVPVTASDRPGPRELQPTHRPRRTHVGRLRRRDAVAAGPPCHRRPAAPLSVRLRPSHHRNGQGQWPCRCGLVLV